MIANKSKPETVNQKPETINYIRSRKHHLPMIQRSTLLHLRIPFSFYLLPIFLFAVSLSPRPNGWATLLAFLILHVLLYPASNGFNSYYDKDEDSIGGLEKPPPVSKELLYTSLVLDGLALLLGIPLGWPFVLGLFIYGFISKAYSHDRIRLKKYPVISWLLASIFQGAFTFLMVYQAINQLKITYLLRTEVVFAASLTSLLLMGFYPMTQIYQHTEDARRGDMTMSRLLGVKGTFIFTFIVFGVTFTAFYFFFSRFFDQKYFFVLMACLAPAVVFFSWWYLKVLRQESAANFRRTMRLNMLSALGTNVFFALLGLWLHY